MALLRGETPLRWRCCAAALSYSSAFAVAQWRCCAVALLLGGAIVRCRFCAVDRGSKMRIEDQGSVALLLRFAKGREGLY